MPTLMNEANREQYTKTLTAFSHSLRHSICVARSSHLAISKCLVVTDS